MDQLDPNMKAQYDRWQSFANVLLLAQTVLIAGTAITIPEQAAALSIVSVVFGLIGIVLSVLWFALENNVRIFGRPALLWLAANAFGFQVGFLFLALLSGHLLNSAKLQ